MKKLHRIALLLIVLIFLSTYNPGGFNSIEKKENSFFEIKNIKIVNTLLVEESEIKEKLNKIYNKNIFLIKRNNIEEPLKVIDFIEKIEVKKNIQIQL